MFRNRHQIDKCPEIWSVSGDGKENVYVLDIDKDGKTVLILDHQHDLYAEIQSHTEACTITNILNRYMNGDVNALNVVNGQFFDATDMPTNYAEIFQRVNECERIFNELPLEQREKFNNSYTEFWSSFGNAVWSEKLGLADSEVNGSDVEIKSSVEVSGKSVTTHKGESVNE